MNDRESVTFEAVKTHHEDEDRAPLYSVVLRRDGSDGHVLNVIRMRPGQPSAESAPLPTIQAAMDLELEFVKEKGGHVCNDKCSRWVTA
jgi:hypothetical protein